MNVIFSIVLITSIIILMIKNPDSVLSAMQNGGQNAIKLAFTLLITYSIWNSVLNIMEKTKITEKIAKAFRPLIRKMFKGESDKTYEYISINFASNMLGLSGVATPSGINAIESMNTDDHITKNMVKLTVISATSLQLIPTTILSLMSSANSVNPSSIILPTLISTFVSTISGIILVDVFVK